MNTAQIADASAKAADYVREKIGAGVPDAAIVLGSGLGALAKAVEDPIFIPYDDIPSFPSSTVIGHASKLVSGTLEGKNVLLQSGRFHMYEGHDPATVVLPVRTFSALGVETLFVTNAAGGLNRTFAIPSLMLIADHVNLMARYPLTGPLVAGELRFPDMSSPYDPELLAVARQAARDEGIRLEEGVYVAVLGPSYETRSEVHMLSHYGDAVGMSTVPEVVVAVARGMKVLGISSITNPAAGISAAPLVHTEVLAAGEAVARDLEILVRRILRSL